MYSVQMIVTARFEKSGLISDLSEFPTLVDAYNAARTTGLMDKIANGEAVRIGSQVCVPVSVSFIPEGVMPVQYHIMQPGQCPGNDFRIWGGTSSGVGDYASQMLAVVRIGSLDVAKMGDYIAREWDKRGGSNFPITIIGPNGNGALFLNTSYTQLLREQIAKACAAYVYTENPDGIEGRLHALADDVQTHDKRLDLLELGLDEIKERLNDVAVKAFEDTFLNNLASRVDALVPRIDKAAAQTTIAADEMKQALSEMTNTFDELDNRVRDLESFKETVTSQIDEVGTEIREAANALDSASNELNTAYSRFEDAADSFDIIGRIR